MPIEIHKEELVANWGLGQKGDKLFKIDQLNIIMKYVSCLKIILLVASVSIVSCENGESFDVLAAQRQLSGKWECIEDNGKEYEITVLSDEIMNVHFKNLCDMGENETVNVILLKENSLLIPSQDKVIYSIEGIGSISNKYKEMILELNFYDKTIGSEQVIVNCIKK